MTTCDEEVLHRRTNADANIPPGSYCVLSVRDDGVGMDAATKARIFEPFFTTKPTGKGTGLGLSTVYGIVRQASGHIQVSSDLGVGTEFRIYFPRLPAEEHEAPLINREIDLDGDETVLIVEDHEQVRSLLTGAFRSRGYSVLEARDGADALNVLAAHSAPIHLVISDVVMPEMNGLDLVVLLRTWYPEVRALLVSGYSDEVTRLHGGLPDGVFYLPKPFTAGEVLVRARHILDAS